MSLSDGQLTAPSTLGMSVLLIIGGVLYALEALWDAVGMLWPW